MIIKFLIEKEFKKFIRSPFLPKLVIIFPLMIMLVMPWAATMDIKNIKTIIVDNDHSAASRQLIEKIAHSTYFNIVDVVHDYEEAIEEVEYGDSDLVLEIPAGFDNDLTNLGTSPVQISVNAVNSIKGGMGQVYMSQLVSGFSVETAHSSTASIQMPRVEVSIKNMYNPLLDYKYTMLPALMVIQLVLMCGFLPALSIVEEKEMGTIEQMNVTPVTKLQFVLAKLIPYWIIGFISMSLTFLFAWLFYGLLPLGSFGTIYLLVALFILTMTGLGVVVSNYSGTMQQAMFVMFFFIIIFIMMSGIMTPFKSMPNWAQAVGSLSPAKYVVNAMRCLYIKGSGLSDLTLDLVVLSVMVVVLNTWAIFSYKKYN